MFNIAQGQPESLGKVQLEMCEATGVEDHPDHNCGLYDSMLWIGAAICRRGDGFTTSQEGFDKYRAENPTQFTEDEWELIHRFTVRDYHYTCWR
jgi:hypothetical protein